MFCTNYFSPKLVIKCLLYSQVWVFPFDVNFIGICNAGKHKYIISEQEEKKEENATQSG